MNALFNAVRHSMQGLPEEVAPGVLEASFLFAETFAGFDGHFPGNPIVPGIAQIMAAVQTASPDGSFRLRQVSRGKFTDMVRPGEAMLVRAVVREAQAGGQLHVAADCVTANGPCARLKLVLER